MKKILKIILTISCWMIGIILLYETLCSIKGIDPWGLGFAFYSLPIGIISILFLIEAVILTKDIINKKGSGLNGKNKMHKLDLILIVGIGVIAIFSALLDICSGVNFPVYSCMSIYASYALLIILLIYSSLKYKENQDKSQMLGGLCVLFYHFYILRL